MSRPKKWASDAERKQAWRARNVATACDETQIETKPCDETMPRDETPCDETPCSDVPLPSSFVPFRGQAHVPLSLFDGCGRGTIRRHTDGRDYVLVSRHTGPEVGELGVVSATDWSVRLGQRCEHGQAGWACHRC